MANFFEDNDDIRFLFDHFDVAALADLQEEGFSFHDEFECAPENREDAVDNYRRILELVGRICAEEIAPTAEETDKTGPVLNHDDGSVTYAPGIAKAIDLLARADLMGFTLPYKYGGINCPQLIYTMSNDILSRADAALMNIYGLQGIAETINAFSSEEIKDRFLPDMASGAHTGAMVLTEPDAGSDLQAVKTRAYQDEEGNWFIHGVKRFITNGCGEVLLVLCRTEPEISDGRGLSLLICERGPLVKIRRLENKLGIHGSPTCEIYFDHVPAQLIGERQRGLITYVMSLMNGARIGIAAQSLGIGEAAFRVARQYGATRRQFEVTIDNFPAIRELLAESQVDIQAARSLTYYATYCVDREISAAKKQEYGNLEGAEKKANKKILRKISRFNKLLTPMSKYYASEMSMRVSNNAIAVLGGSGYMKDYPVERHMRDSRITTIYEGTTQLQVVAAVAGITSGTCRTVLEELVESPTRADEWAGETAGIIEQVRGGMEQLDECVEFVKSQSPRYRDLCARRLVDMGINLIVAVLFCDQALSPVDDDMAARKLSVARRWAASRMPENSMNRERILSGDQQIDNEFETLAGPVPVAE